MNLAIVCKYDLKIHGYSSMPQKFLDNKYIVLYQLELDEKFNNLIELYQSLLRNSIVPNHGLLLIPIKFTYIIDSFMFCEPNYNFCNLISFLKNRYKNSLPIRNKHWVTKFKKIRGRYPNKYDISLFI